MKPICTLQNLTLSFPHKLIFDSVSFTLNHGERIGVLGLNGHGKSSLFKVLMGEQAPDTTVPPFKFDKSQNFSIFMVPQELPIKDKSLTLSDYFYEFHPKMKKLRVELNIVEKQFESADSENIDIDQLINRQSELYEKLEELSESNIHNQYLSYLKHFGLNDPNDSIEHLSGGEKRKIALSLGLSAPQEVILWDEPTNHLDLETIELFEDELMGLKKTLLIISHDRSLLNNVTDRIIHIQRGALLSFTGNYSQYLEYLNEQEKIRLQEITKLSNTHRRETAWMRRGVSARRTKSKKRIEDYAGLTNQIQELHNRSHRKASLQLKSSNRKSKRLMVAKELGISFDQNKLFSDINFEICKGDKLALMGRNGVGKSTLINALIGKLPPTSGKIERAQNLNIGFFSQHRDALDENLSPWEIIGDGTDYVLSNDGNKKHVASYLESFLFSSEELKRPLHTFSGGEKNRLHLAKFMKDAKDIWIFDEPTNDLDLETIGILEEELKDYKGAVILICHDRSFIENVADSCWVLENKTLEYFEAGFEHAKAFLEAYSLEKKLEKLSPTTPTSLIKENVAPTAKTETPKVNYAQKVRYDEIHKEIEAQEDKINKIQSLMGQFDFNKMDAEQTELLAQLQKKIDFENKKLEKLMEEWTRLEELNQ